MSRQRSGQEESDIESGAREESQQLLLNEEEADEDEDEDYDFDDDDSDYIFDSDEDEEFNFEDAHLWQKELAGVKDPSISEATLHAVPWSDVLVEIVTNSLTIAAFTIVLVVLDKSPLLLLGLFCIFSMLVVSAVEVARAQGTAKAAFFGLAAVGPLPLLLVCHASRSSVFVMMGMWIFALSAAWLVLCAMCGKHQFIYRSALYQACFGLVRVQLRSRKDIAMLAKGIKYIHTSKLRAAADSISFYTRKLSMYKLTSIGVGTVQTDPDPRVPNVKLKLDGMYLDEGDFVLSHVMDSDPAADPKPLDLASLETTLKRRGNIADKVISTWFGEEQADKKETKEQEKVRKWFVDHEPDNYPLKATFKRINRWDSLYNHWAPRALTCLCVAVVASLPMLRIVKATVLMQGDLCKTPVPAKIFLPDGSLLCGATDIASCATACANMVNFFEAVNAALHTSYVEILFMFVLVPVIIFTLAVQYVAQMHEKLEKEYFERLRLSKVASRELLESKAALEDLMSLQKLWQRFTRRFQAWNPLDLGDPDLVACGRMSPAEVSGSATAYENDALMQTLARVRSVLSSVNPSEEVCLTYGLRVDPAEPEEGETEEEMGSEEKELMDEVGTSMADNAIVGASDRNFKAVFTVKCQNVKTWFMWKKWLGIEQDGKPAADSYERQLKHILMNQQSQDSGRGSHVDADNKVIIGDQAIPRGFSLTHIYTSKREDKSLFQIDVGGDRKADAKAPTSPGSEVKAALDELKKEIGILEKIVKVPATLPKEGDDFEDPLEGEEEAICIRFCLSEQYFNRLRRDDSNELDKLLTKKIEGLKNKAVQEKLQKKKEDAKSYFADFVRIMLAPEVGKEEANEDGGTTSGLTFVLADMNPLRAVFRTAGELFSRLMVFLSCLVFVLVVPFWRFFIQGGSFFPQPYSGYLALNCILSALAMWYFLNDFHTTSYRLELIAGCLGDFEQKTLDPSGKAGKKKDGKAAEGPAAAKEGETAPAAGGAADDPAPAAEAADAGAADEGDGKARGAGGNKASPFDLTINESSSTKYDPNDKWWKDEWMSKQKNVENWHLSAGYLRVFVSSSRLTAQTILLAAAAILTFLLVFSFVQAVQGRGVAKVSSGELKGLASSASGGRRLMEPHEEPLAMAMFLHALQTSQHDDILGMDMVRSEGYSAIGLLGQEEKQAVEMPLTEFLERANLTKHLGILQDLGVETSSDVLAYLKEDDLVASGMPVVHVRKLFTAAREAHRVTKESADALQPKLWDGGRALAEKEEAEEGDEEDTKHLDKAMAALKRVNITKITKTQILTIVLVLLLLTYSVPLIWYMAKVNDSFDRHGSLLVTTKEVHRMNMARREESLALPDKDADEDEEPSQPKPDAPKDMAAKRYERLLDLAIQSASENRSRFPLKLFGFIINSAVLGGWIALAMSPVLQEAQHLVPEVVMMGCSYMENSGLLDQAQAMADTGTAATNAVLTAGHHGASTVGTFNTKKLFHDFVCTPLQDYMEKQSEAAADKVEDSLAAPDESAEEEPASEKRRLAMALRQAHAQAAELQSLWANYRGQMQKQHRVLRQLLDASPRRGDL
mmetsp:Transcript_2613/g.6698  ORF Transcript_2613/g.6698 Transcript_2613/m.6698 type:complete len:1576 (+) Transcript_2613:63-4790(+)